jgi:hypothetical protein
VKYGAEPKCSQTVSSSPAAPLLGMHATITGLTFSEVYNYGIVFHNGVHQPPSRLVQQALHGPTGNTHPGAGLFLIQVFHVTQPESFELIEADHGRVDLTQRNPLRFVHPVGAVTAAETPLPWSRHHSIFRSVHMHKINMCPIHILVNSFFSIHHPL